MKVFTAAAFAAACAMPGLVHAQAPAGLEVRFCPGAQLRTYPLESVRGVQGALLQYAVVINRGPAPVELDRLDLEIVASGDVVDSRRVTGAALTKLAAGGPRLQASGMMQAVPFLFCGDRLIPRGAKLAGPVLQPGEAMLVSQQPFAWKGARDQIRVSAHAKGSGGEASGSAGLPIVSGASKTAFRFPLKGSWYVPVGPTPHTGHRWANMEEFAFDIARFGDGNSSHRGDGQKFEDYYAYGAEVLAAADGKVVAAVDGEPEDASALRKPGESQEAYGERVGQLQGALMMRGSSGIAGDHVIIDHGNGEYSLYAHLKPGSLKVKPGDVVKAGQPIARLGSSGNSTEPHLHFQVCDAPDALACAGIPINFTGIELPYADGPRAVQSGDIVVAD